MNSALPLFFSDLLKRLIDKHLFGQEFLELCILRFKFFEAFDLGYAHSTISTFPLVKGLFADIIFADGLSMCIGSFCLLQYLYDLRFTESLLADDS